MESFRIFCTVLLYCWSRQAISLDESTRLAKPDIRTGVPLRESILRDAAGLDPCPLAKPQDMIEPRDFLKEDSLWRMLGIFPAADLMELPVAQKSGASKIIPRSLFEENHLYF